MYIDIYIYMTGFAKACLFFSLTFYLSNLYRLFTE